MAENYEYGSLLDDRDPLQEERVIAGENSEVFLEQVSGVNEPCYCI